MKCRIGFGFEKLKPLHLWLLAKVTTDPECRCRLRRDYGLYFSTGTGVKNLW